MKRPDRLALAAFAASSIFACTAPAPAPSPTPPPTPPPMTAEQSVDWYKKCWGLLNDKSWDAFQSCYAPDATSDAVDSGMPPVSGSAAIIGAKKASLAGTPDARGDVQLIVANGNNLASVALWKGTHTAPMPGPDGKEIPATGKKFGFLMGHALELDASRTAVRSDADYFEVGTYLAQLGLSKAPARPVMESGAAEPVVAIAKNDETEAANVAVVTAMAEALNKHDVKAVAGAYADSYVLHEIARPKDDNKKEALAVMAELLKGFPDATFSTSRIFAAGDYVVVAGSFQGTNKGGIPSMGVKKNDKAVSLRSLDIFRLQDGKIVEEWLFYNGAAMAAQLGLQ